MDTLLIETMMSYHALHMRIPFKGSSAYMKADSDDDMYDMPYKNATTALRDFTHTISLGFSSWKDPYLSQLKVQKFFVANSSLQVSGTTAE